MIRAGKPHISRRRGWWRVDYGLGFDLCATWEIARYAAVMAHQHMGAAWK